ncbi:hypothetical protein AB1Y20_001018 [Prymnesium parvum]|uniref:Uncharacterized protein n=1 Tax=Prymnesium parvum TaxID=97485 RepID=A0AB34KAR6_PRYPA
MEARLREVLHDPTLAATLCERAHALRLLDLPALHDALKKEGVKTMGLRQRVCAVLSDSPPPPDTLGAALRSRLEGAGLHSFVATLCPIASQLSSQATDPRTLQAALKAAGVSTLGHRQQVANIIRLLDEARTASSVAPTGAPSPSSSSQESRREQVHAQQLKGKDVEGLQLEENHEGLQLEENDEGLQLEENDEEALQLEENDEQELQLEENDEEELQLEENDEEGLQLEENDEEALQLEENDEERASQPTRTQHGEADGDDMELSLITPPELPELSQVYDEAKDPVDALRKAGTNGTQRFQRSVIINRLLELDPVSAESAELLELQDRQPLRDRARLQEIHGHISSLHLSCQSTMLLDRRYRDAFAAAASAAGAPIEPHSLASGLCGGRAPINLDALLEIGERRQARVCVLGLGSGFCALLAAKAGAQVVWIERIGTLARMCTALVKANGLERRVTVVTAKSWEEAVWPRMEPFDSVITEELSEDVLADGILPIARVARSKFLTKKGTMLPRRIVLWGALGSVRTKRVSGFDLRGFNALRNNAGAVYDMEEVMLNEQGAGRMLSSAIRLMDIDLNQPPAPGHQGPFFIRAHASEAGILNCLVTWFEIEMPSGERVSFAPDEAQPKHMYFRAMRQRLHFLEYERRLSTGEEVALTFSHDDLAFTFEAPADARARSDGRLRQWAVAPALSYHFAMIAEGVRNDKFEQPLLAAIREFIERHDGRRPHVLDIGSGSGLLAMMAARGGAAKVTSVEVVPQMAAIARYIVAANGYADVVTIHNCRSDELPVEVMGGRADILVSELVDDHLIGDGILQSHADARRRLLVPNPTIIPWGGKVYAWPLQMRLPSPAGVDITPLHVPRCHQVVIPYPYASDKIQRSPPGYHKPLAQPVHLFDFDWGRGPLDTLCDERLTNEIPFIFTVSGTFNAIALLFSMQMDMDPEHDYSDFLENPDTHWDQPIRFLPNELRVNKGETLRMIAAHNDNDIHQIKLLGVKRAMLEGQLGIIIPRKEVADKLHVVLKGDI